MITLIGHRATTNAALVLAGVALFLATAGCGEDHPAAPAPLPPLRVHTVAGTGVGGYNGDAGQATLAQLFSPTGLALSPSGMLYVSDFNGHRVRRIDTRNNLISTVAGTGAGGFSGDNNPATSAQLFHPGGLCLDSAGNLFVADIGNYRVRRIDAQSGIITTVAGTGTAGYNGDHRPATTAQLNDPAGVWVSPAGNLYIADFSNARIRKVDGVTDSITTVVGDGTPCFPSTNPCGDGGLATSAQLSGPTGVSMDAQGHLLISEQSNHRVRRVDGLTGMISTVAGTGTMGFNGDTLPATSAQLHYPREARADGAGNVWISDQFNHRLRVMNAATGVMSTVAGTGTAGYNGEGVRADSAQFSYPTGLAIAPDGTVYICSPNGHRLQRVDR